MQSHFVNRDRSSSAALLEPARKEETGMEPKLHTTNGASSSQHTQAKGASGSWPADNFLVILVIGLFAFLMLCAGAMSF
jgi:hypothetical protein